MHITCISWININEMLWNYTKIMNWTKLPVMSDLKYMHKRHKNQSFAWIWPETVPSVFFSPKISNILFVQMLAISWQFVQICHSSYADASFSSSTMSLHWLSSHWLWSTFGLNTAFDRQTCKLKTSQSLFCEATWHIKDCQALKAIRMALDSNHWFVLLSISLLLRIFWPSSHITVYAPIY